MTTSNALLPRRRHILRAMLAAAACGVVAVPTAAAPRTHTVTMEGTTFSPETITVKRGDRVLWKNKDPFPHTATATSKAFDSGSIAEGKSWTYVASKSGTFDYVCTLHPTMKAKLIVE